MTAGDKPRVCFVMLYYAPESVELGLDIYLKRTPVHWALPRALAERGYEVHVVHLWAYDASWKEAGVRFHFIAESRLSRAVSNIVGSVRSGDAAAYQPAWRAIRLIKSLRPDVVHFHGCTLTLNLCLLTRAFRDLPATIFLHYHGGYPSRHRLVHVAQRYGFDHADRYCFSTRAHATPFVGVDLIRDSTRIIELMETSSTFVPRDRSRARQETGMTGEPVMLSVGRLHPVKDPLVMLDGFARVLREWPMAQLYLYYTSDELLPDVRCFLDQRPGLSDHVHLRGRAEPEAMADIYNSADFLLQASQREFSGCAVLEAMACGVIPIVSDIPSFRAMTGDGRYGALFSRGDSEGLARAVLTFSAEFISDYRREIRARFEQALSFRHLAEQLDEQYRRILRDHVEADRLKTVAS